MLRWGIRLVSLIVLAAVLLWSWSVNLAPGSSGAAWVLTLMIATIGWATLEWSLIGLSFPGPTLRRRLMLDGLSLRGAPLFAGLYLVVTAGTALLGGALHPDRVYLDYLELSSPGGTILLQILGGLAGVLLGAIAFLTLVVPVAFTLAAVIFDNRNESAPRTWFGLMNRGELIGSAMLLPAIPVALVAGTIGVTAGEPGFIVLAALMIIPLLLGALINNLGTSARKALGEHIPLDEPLIKRVWR